MPRFAVPPAKITARCGGLSRGNSWQSSREPPSPGLTGNKGPRFMFNIFWLISCTHWIAGVCDWARAARLDQLFDAQSAAFV